MKALVLSAIVFASICSSASAADLYIHSNVFTTSGPATATYFTNLSALQTAFSAVSKSEMGTLKFNGASVKEDGSVVYNFHKFESESSKEVCWSALSFTRTGTEQAPVISDVKAELNCYANQD